MKVTLTEHSCVVEREAGDKKLYSESLLWYKVKRELQKQGHDVIKKRMQKDGHLMGDESTQYVRHRKWKFAIYDGDWQIRAVYEPYNQNGRLELPVDRWEGD